VPQQFRDRPETIPVDRLAKWLFPSVVVQAPSVYERFVQVFEVPQAGSETSTHSGVRDCVPTVANPFGDTSNGYVG
jgi:hypothetical protein